ncbi:bifunctional aspartate kinase/diaminopimelate decarboxylase [Kangiella sediminilitoris]|uniref:aspartate kinase n=1 Tax=Kangiella sediminilitoris TaxID=1144748 RepID=A0A1B3BBW6_9GAMM|nr:bifunctional aspartate kinase/diaminopimelate decarboxylase [Kangiella sediminilitoris]AOE50285.1 Aspartate kinase [Kangiella sediminilitoris]
MSNSNSWHVLKFGGTSVSSRDNWNTIAAIIKRKRAKGIRVFVVHSAVSTVSNRLESLIGLADGGDYRPSYQQLITLHQELLVEMGLPETLLDQQYAYLKRLLDGIHLLGEVSDRVRALIMSQGELWSTRIGQAYLQTQLDESVNRLDARDFLKANESYDVDYLCANCDYSPDGSLIRTVEESSVVITQGFIASTSEDETVLLGRGGSDTSAAYFAAKLEAERLEIWTDVPGIFTANPNQVNNARLLKELNYDEAQEMASAGAKVLHPRAIRPAQATKIPVYIRSTIDPDIEGTIINDVENRWGMVKAITAKEHITLISMESQGMWQQAGFLADIFSIFKQHQVSVDLVSTSETNITVSLDSLTQVVSEKQIKNLAKDLSKMCRVNIMHDCSAVSIVGKNVRAILHKIAPAFSIFETYKVYLLSQAASDLNLTFVIDDEHSNKVITALHELLITNNPNSEILGPTAKELKQVEQTDTGSRWWQDKQQEITQCLKDRDSAYIYHLDSVKQNIQNLQSISAIERIFFAVKSNNNPDVLKVAYESDIGFETVSSGEVDHILNLFPSIDKSRIFFTPNFAARHEYEAILEKGIRLTLDSTYPIRQWPEIFRGKDVFLRVDPNIGKGHHENVRTAGATSKFGIPIYELEDLQPVIEEYDINVVGLHAHAGSGILTNEHWAEHARLLAETAALFSGVKYLNLGGGFGIKERAQQSELTMSQIDKSLQKVKSEYPQYELWIEPGRYISANTGVLVSKVTQVKQKQNYYYVGLSTGMNSLMRPALYGSYHNIVNLSRLEQTKEHLATVVGPICESTDKLGVEIPFPETLEGDLVLIENAGAYGHVMSTQYNMRKPAEEVCI